MGPRPKIFALAASLRDGSLNVALLDCILAELAGIEADVERIDYTAFLDAPLYSGPREQAEGVPPQMQALAQRIAGCQGLILVTPEYNHGIPGGFKNGIDWMSRVSPVLLRGKPTLIGGASVSPYGAWRGMKALRSSVEFLGALTLPYMISIGSAASGAGVRDQCANPAARPKIEAALEMFARQLALQTAATAAPGSTGA